MFGYVSIAFLVLLPTTSSLHVFLSHPEYTIVSRRTFNLVIQGSDCVFDPCIYSVKIDGISTVSGTYTGTKDEVVSLTVTKPGRRKVLVYFTDDDSGNGLPFGATSTGTLPLVFIIPVQVEDSHWCNYVTFSVDGTPATSLSYNTNTDIYIDVYNSLGQSVTNNYLHNGVNNPVFIFTNGTTNFTLTVPQNSTSWRLTLTEDTVLARTQDGALVPQRDWDLTLTFSPVYQDLCLISPGRFTVSLLSPVFTKPEQYFGNSVDSALAAGTGVEVRKSPCSSSLRLIFQLNSTKFGLNYDDTITWYNVPGSGGVTGKLLDAILLPDGVVMVTSLGVVTVTHVTSSSDIVDSSLGIHEMDIASGRVEGRVQCPSDKLDVIHVTVDGNKILRSSSPYRTWETLSSVPDQGCTFWNSYHDPIRDMDIIVQDCGSGVLRLNSTGPANAVYSSDTQLDTLSGSLWHSITADLYLFGEKVQVSSDRGLTFTTLLTLPGDELVVEMVAGDRTGQLIAVTSTGRLFLSHVGIGRFCELHNIHSSTPSPLTFYSTDNTAHLSVHFVTATTITRYEIPKFAVFSDSIPFDSPLYLEVVDTDVTRVHSSNQKEGFLPEDAGKVLHLPDNSGSARVISTDTSYALLDLEQPFQKISGAVIAIDGPNDDGTFTIGKVGTWSVADMGASVVVLDCTSFLIKSFMSSSSVKAIPLHPNRVSSCLGIALSENEWFLANLNPYRSVVSVTLNTLLTVTSSSGGKVTLNSNNPVSDEVQGLVVTIREDRKGIVQSSSSSEIVIFSSETFDTAEEFPSWEVVYSAPGGGLLSRDYTRESSWTFTEPECELVLLDSNLQNLSHPVPLFERYLDTNVESIFTATIADRRTFPAQPPHFTSSFENRDQFEFFSDVSTSSHISNYRVAMQHGSELSGIDTSLTLSPRPTSIRCAVPSLLHLVHRDCDPQTRIVVRYPFVGEQNQFLEEDLTDPSGNKLLKRLPINYRPPSSYGREISLSPNVYNVDPSLTPHRSKKVQSRDLYRYQQCAGSSSTDTCGCTQHMRISDLSVDSDCRELVYTVPFTSSFVPNIHIIQHGLPPRPLNKTYVITEVNGREEYEVFDLQLQPLDPSCNASYCSLSFLGSELFHFRVKVTAGTICHYETEFLVYVVDVPLTTTLHNIITVIVGAKMFFIIQLYYMCTKRKEQKMSQHELDSKSLHSNSESTLTSRQSTENTAI